MSKINETNYPRRTQANYADTDMLVIQAAGGNTYTTRLEDMREDYEETLAPTLSALQNDVNENLATIEGSTASQAYAKGDFLVFGGRLCKAKTSIASGATLVLDTNIELDSVGDELSSLSSQLTSVRDFQNDVVIGSFGNQALHRAFFSKSTVTTGGLSVGAVSGYPVNMYGSYKQNDGSIVGLSKYFSGGGSTSFCTVYAAKVGSTYTVSLYTDTAGTDAYVWVEYLV